MTVAELIEQLQKLPQDLLVFTEYDGAAEIVICARETRMDAPDFSWIKDWRKGVPVVIID